MFRAKDVILYKKIRFRFSSEEFVDILKKSIKCIFAYLSFLGKLLKEFRQEKFFWLKITKGIQAWKVCCTNHGFWCAWGVHIPFRNTKSTKNTFSEDIFQKKVEKNIWIPNFEIDQISEFCLKTMRCSCKNWQHLTPQNFDSKILLWNLFSKPARFLFGSYQILRKWTKSDRLWK